VIDSWTRECLGLVADTSLSGRRVARELHNIVRQRGRPRAIVRDNGTEYTSNAILGWADDTGVDCHYIAPSKTLFRSLPHARAVLEV
jgi:putative transposase